MPKAPTTIDARIANWHSITRLHLSERVPAASIPQVAESMIGIHAARIQSPIVSVATRSDGPDAGSLAGRLYRSPELIKMRCMRGTLHIVPTQLAPILHAATLAARLSVCRQIAKQFAVTSPEERAIADTITERLSRTTMSSEQIVSQLSASVARKTKLHRLEAVYFLRSLIKTLWEAGHLCIHNVADDWKQETRMYGLTRDRYPDLRLHELDATTAAAALLAHYFRRYGPASVADAAWWSGLGQARVRAFVAEADSRLVALRVSGTSYPSYMYAEDYESLRRIRVPAGTHVEFLAHEDNLLKGYKESRLRFVSSEAYPLVFNAIGEARATILVNGRVVGIWSYDKKTGGIGYSLFRALDRNIQVMLDARRERLQGILSSNGR